VFDSELAAGAPRRTGVTERLHNPFPVAEPVEVHRFGRNVRNPGAMRENVARRLQVPLEFVSVKAKTSEGMGYTGDGSGIAVYAVALLRRAQRGGDRVAALRTGRVTPVPLYQVVVLGIVQGLTEFLPVSSTAHLYLTSWLMGWQVEALDFDIALHIGTLLAVLRVSAGHGLNMRKLESRPSRERVWEYVFWIDLDGDASDPAMRTALDEVGGVTTLARVLGSYPSEDR